MNGKERTLRAISHQEPDRVPVGEWGVDHDHVSRVIGRHTYWRNRRDTTLALWDNRRGEVVESLKNDYAQLVDALDYDILTVELVPSKHHHVSDRPRRIGEGTWQDSRGTIYRYAASNDSIQCVTTPEGVFELTDEEVEAAIAQADTLDDSQFELIDFICDRYGGEKAIVCRSVDIYTPLFKPFHGDFNHELMLSCIASDELERLRPALLAYNQRIIDHCAAKGVDILMQGQDFGMNSGCIMRPEHIRDIFMPVVREVNQRALQANMIPFFHCCGNIWDILNDFVDAGYQGYQSIQESAGMDNARVKREYGDRLTMWTGVQCETLIQGSLDEVEREVRRNLELLMPGGGYLFGSTNSVQYGARTDNYLRALELVRKYGVY